MITTLGEISAAGLLLGTDSLFAGLAMGLWVGSRARAAYALLFGVCDGAATVLGSIIPHQAPELPAILVYLVAAGVLALGSRRNRLWLWALPVLFSLDNLAAGYPVAEAPALAIGSAAMAGLGLAFGGLGRRLAMQLAMASA